MKHYKLWLEIQIQKCLEDPDLQREHWAFCKAYENFEKFNMEVKQLNWRDNISDQGKSNGYFEILSDVVELGITYHIRNYKYFSDPPSAKYYFFQERRDGIIEFDSLQEAKLKAQWCFKQTILDYFFTHNE